MDNRLNNKDPFFEIIEGCIKEDRKCQKYVYEKFYGKMFGICLRYAANREEAKDLTQDGFLKIFLNIRSYSHKGSFEGWMRKIMTNHAIDAYRKNRHNPEHADSDAVEENTVQSDEEENENEKWYLDIQPEEIINAIQQLSPAYRTVFNMYVVDGFTHKEIAARLNISEGSSKSNFAKAKMNLKKILEYRRKQIKSQINA